VLLSFDPDKISSEGRPQQLAKFEKALLRVGHLLVCEGKSAVVPYPYPWCQVSSVLPVSTFYSFARLGKRSPRILFVTKRRDTLLALSNLSNETGDYFVDIVYTVILTKSGYRRARRIGRFGRGGPEFREGHANIMVVRPASVQTRLSPDFVIIEDAQTLLTRRSATGLRALRALSAPKLMILTSPDSRALRALCTEFNALTWGWTRDLLAEDVAKFGDSAAVARPELTSTQISQETIGPDSYYVKLLGLAWEWLKRSRRRAQQSGTLNDELTAAFATLGVVLGRLTRATAPLDEVWKAEERLGYVPTPRRLELLQGQLAGLKGVEELQLDGVASYCESILTLDPPKYEALRTTLHGQSEICVTVADQANMAALKDCGFEAPIYLSTQAATTAGTHLVPFMTSKMDVNYSMIRGISAPLTKAMLYPQEEPFLERLKASEAEVARFLLNRESVLQTLHAEKYGKR
jgi:hypothetical protein